MADISAEITAFRNAVYGEDVRSAMISLANKLNTEITNTTSEKDVYYSFANSVSNTINNETLHKYLMSYTKISSISYSYITNNYWLLDNGTYAASDGWDVYKYTVSASVRGNTFYISFNGLCQFQNSLGLSGDVQKIAGPFVGSDIYLEWPSNATYLMISSTSEPEVYICSDNLNSLNNDLIIQHNKKLHDTIIDDEVIEPSYTSENIYLSNDGSYSLISGYTVYKFANSRKLPIVHITGDFICQFQNSVNTNPSANILKIAGPFVGSDIYLEWPSNATYLMISSTLEPEVALCYNSPEISDLIDSTQYEIDSLINNQIIENELEQSFETVGYWLLEDGTYEKATGWTVHKYSLLSFNRNRLIHVKNCNGLMQFQNILALSGDVQKIAGPFVGSDIYLEWPSNASYFMVSSTVEPEVYTCDYIKPSMEYSSFQAGSINSQGIITNDTVRIMSYNLAKYNHDTTINMSDFYIFNFRKMLSAYDPDIIATQEDKTYIDSDESKVALNYLYNPLYPYIGYSTSECRIHSKKESIGTSNSLMLYWGRWCSFATFSFYDKTLLVVSAHCSTQTTDQAIQIRYTQYSNLMDWMNGDITLPSYSDNSVNIEVPTHTHSILCMDANSLTDSDLSNLETLASEKGYILGNGGRFGWLPTAMSSGNKITIDNIIVSTNCVIQNIDTGMDWWFKLYSDHTPLIANVILLD